jgi:excisionase family DNA binding protein|nr:MAG TPA: excisionase [Bacteriophage sp.]
MKEVPVWEKTTLTLEEAAAYTGIGVHKLREITDDESNQLVLWVGKKRLIKRKPLEKYIDQTYSV